MTDVPTLTSATAANFAVLNPINKGSTATISNANLGANSNGSTWNGVVNTIAIPRAGKWYWEVTASGVNTSCGIVLASTNFSTALATFPANGFFSYTYYGSNGNKVSGPSNTQTAYGATYTNGDVIGIALDTTAGTLVFYKNNTSQGTAFTSLTDEYFAYCGVAGTTAGAANFGQRPFSYTPPTGFVALNTYNIAAGSVTTIGTFTGNSNANGPFVYLNGVPTAMTINGSAVTFGTDADKLSNGFKVRSSSATYNLSGSNAYVVTTTGAVFKYANAQGNP